MQSRGQRGAAGGRAPLAGLPWASWSLLGGATFHLLECDQRAWLFFTPSGPGSRVLVPRPDPPRCGDRDEAAGARPLRRRRGRDHSRLAPSARLP